ncbi:hypothetical protein N7492_002774 [Penicillium capsulatum]|uniref:Uncharacterized protein n=1 Tax=Penicillium capsulatum TaxID=69766 RepID=A0A9W9IIE5_9EURO|nr:hypothetical protein N7492_002774 [Penicillium capsulatum]
MDYFLVSDGYTKIARDLSALPTMSDEVDQSTNLPKVTDIIYLPDAPLFLEKPVDFEEWLKGVIKILRPRQLDQLVDIRIPRPDPNSPRARQWKELSIKVRMWLTFQMSHGNYMGVNRAANQTELADEFMMHARILFQESCMDSVTKQMNVLFLSRRADFESAIAYIQAMWNHYVQHSALKTHVKPCVVLARIFFEVRPEIPDFIDYRKGVLDAQGNVWNKLSFEDAEDACDSVIDYLNNIANPTLEFSWARSGGALTSSPCQDRKRKRDTEKTQAASDIFNAVMSATAESVADGGSCKIDWPAKISGLLKDCLKKKRIAESRV